MKYRRFHLVSFLLLGSILFGAAPTLQGRTWQEILRSGKLRVLTTEADRSASGLQRIEMPIDRERALLRQFAEKNHLTIEYISSYDFASLFIMLNIDRGDLISANIAATPARRAQFLLSAPFAYTREIIFGREDLFKENFSMESLFGKTGEILPGTTFENNFRVYAAQDDRIRFNILPRTISNGKLIERIAQGQADYSVVDECDLDAWLSYRSGVRKLFPLKEHVELVFAAKKSSRELIENLNRFLMDANPSLSKEAADASIRGAGNDQIFTGDLDEIRRRGYIRMLTTNDVFNCYLQKGEIRGFEYEIARRFARSLQLSVVTVIPANFNDLPKMLAEGKGDFIAANFTRTPERVRQYADFTFCEPYCGVTQVIVGRADEKISSLADLEGRTIYAKKGKIHYDTLMRMQKEGAKFKVVPFEEDLSNLFAVRQVADKKFDLTAVDDTTLQFAVNNGCDAKIIMPISEEQPFAWVTRKNNPALTAAINDFFRREMSGSFFKSRQEEYFGSKKTQPALPGVNDDKTLELSPYDKIFQKYGALYNIPWYVLVAQAYRESRFKSDLVSANGGTGLMQITPDVARQLGVSNLTNPERGIEAGAKYLATLRDRFTDAATPEDRLCFALASYNAGYGHILDARELAEQQGLNPRVWFRNTEKALALLQEPQYASRAKFGYCQASETIPYVKAIMSQGNTYREMLEVEKRRLSETPGR